MSRSQTGSPDEHATAEPRSASAPKPTGQTNSAVAPQQKSGRFGVPVAVLVYISPIIEH